MAKEIKMESSCFPNRYASSRDPHTAKVASGLGPGMGPISIAIWARGGGGPHIVLTPASPYISSAHYGLEMIMA